MSRKKLFNVLTWDNAKDDYTPELIDGVETQGVDRKQVVFVLGILSTIGYSCEAASKNGVGSDEFTDDPSILIVPAIDSAPALT